MSSNKFPGSCASCQEDHKITNVDIATKNRRLRRRKKSRKANEGMTAAIILIAFIITAAGVAFVILTKKDRVLCGHNNGLLYATTTGCNWTTRSSTSILCHA